MPILGPAAPKTAIKGAQYIPLFKPKPASYVTYAGSGDRYANDSFIPISERPSCHDVDTKLPPVPKFISVMEIPRPASALSKHSLRPASAPISRPGTATSRPATVASRQFTQASQKQHNPSLPPTVPRSTVSNHAGNVESQHKTASIAASAAAASQKQSHMSEKTQSVAKSVQKAVSVAKSGETKVESILLDMFPEGQQPGDTDPNPVVVIDYDLQYTNDDNINYATDVFMAPRNPLDPALPQPGNLYFNTGSETNMGYVAHTLTDKQKLEEEKFFYELRDRINDHHVRAGVPKGEYRQKTFYQTRDSSVIAKINARKTAHLKKPIKIEKNALYEVDWSKGEMGRLLDNEVDKSKLFEKSLQEKLATLKMKVRKLQLENEKLKSELKPTVVEEEEGKKRLEINLEAEKVLLQELKENDKLNVERIKVLIGIRDKLKKEDIQRITNKRNTSPINTKHKTTSTLRDNPYF